MSKLKILKLSQKDYMSLNSEKFLWKQKIFELINNTSEKELQRIMNINEQVNSVKEIESFYKILPARQVVMKELFPLTYKFVLYVDIDYLKSIDINKDIDLSIFKVSKKDKDLESKCLVKSIMGELEELRSGLTKRIIMKYLLRVDPVVVGKYLANRQYMNKKHLIMEKINISRSSLRMLRSKKGFEGVVKLLNYYNFQQD